MCVCMYACMPKASGPLVTFKDSDESMLCMYVCVYVMYALVLVCMYVCMYVMYALVLVCMYVCMYV